MKSKFQPACFVEAKAKACIGSQPSNSVKGKTTTGQKIAATTGTTELAPEADADQASNGILDAAAAYANLNQYLRSIYDALPANTAFIVASGHGDPRTVTALNSKKHRFEMLYKTGKPISTMTQDEKWSEGDERDLQAAVARVREGMTFLAIKH